MASLAKTPIEGDAALLVDQMILDLLPAAVYACDAQGLITRHNRKAAEIWGREPRSGDPSELNGGSHRLFWPDGRPLAHADTPTAAAIRGGQSTRDVEIMIEQPSGHRVYVRGNVDPIRGRSGEVVGAVHCFQDISDRKEAERKLEEKERLLKAIAETTPACVKIVARDGALLLMNEAGLQMVEAESFDAIEGRPTADLIAPEDRADWSARHERVCAGERLRWEFDVVGLRGTRRHMETHAAPLSLPDGTFAQLAITHDATDRKQHEDAVRNSERRLRDLLDALPSAIYTTDAEGHITFYNQAAVEISGRRPELGTDKWCVTWKLFRPDGAPMPHDECPMAMALREKRPIRGIEAVAERPDGTRVPFLPYPTPLFDEKGELAGAVNMLMNISDRRKAEEYAQRLAAIVEGSDDAIVSKDIRGVIQTWNKGAERLFGYEAHEVVGKPVNVLIPPDRPDEEPEILSRIGRGERIDHYETTRLRKDGTLIDVSITVSPLRNAQGRIVGASKIARDVTDRRKQEERRKLLTNELNHRVKNTLATIQSVAAQTFRGGSQAATLRQFEKRLVALSRTHDVLTRESWEGADLAELVEDTISPLCVEPAERFEINGPTLRLRPKVALSLSMALHELCTNAVKHGALLNLGGRVKIAWQVEYSGPARRLRLHWEELDGPLVEAPCQRGFGSRLLERALARELGGKVQLIFPPSGVVCDIEAPLA